jgi:hypothetical protein
MRVLAVFLLLAMAVLIAVSALSTVLVAIGAGALRL